MQNSRFKNFIRSERGVEFLKRDDSIRELDFFKSYSDVKSLEYREAFQGVGLRKQSGQKIRQNFVGNAH